MDYPIQLDIHRILSLLIQFIINRLHWNKWITMVGWNQSSILGSYVPISFRSSLFHQKDDLKTSREEPIKREVKTELKRYNLVKLVETTNVWTTYKNFNLFRLYRSLFVYDEELIDHILIIDVTNQKSV